MTDRSWATWRERLAARIHRRVAALAVSVGVVVVLSAGLMWWLSRLFAGAAGAASLGLDRWLWLAALLPGVFVLAGMVPAVILIRRERRMLRLVPAEDGAVCPDCRRVLDRAGTDGRCAKCARTWTEAELRRRWETYLTPGATRRSRDIAVLFARSDPVDGTPIGWRERLRGRPAKALAAGVVLVVVFSVVGAVVTGGGIVGILGSVVRFGFLFGAIILISLGVPRRAGASRHCASCDYEKPPTGAGAACPECGADWSVPGGTAHGRPRRNLPLLAAGLLFGVVFVFVGNSWFLGGWATGLMPTGPLISSITTKRGFVDAPWAELNKRPLTIEQRHRLFAGLLDKRRRQDYLSRHGDAWMVGEVAAGAVPAPLLDRFYREMIEVTGVEPKRAVVGRPFVPEVLLRHRAPLWQTESSLLVVEGIYLDGADAPAARSERPRWTLDLTGDGHRRGRLDNPELAVTPTAPGPLRLRIVLWHLYAPLNAKERTARWSDDGALVLPEGTVFSERQVIEHTVDVRPAP